MWISVLWHSRFHCPGILLLGTQKYDIEAYTGTILNFFQDILIYTLLLRLILLFSLSEDKTMNLNENY